MALLTWLPAFPQVVLARTAALPPLCALRATAVNRCYDLACFFMDRCTDAATVRFRSCCARACCAQGAKPRCGVITPPDCMKQHVSRLLQASLDCDRVHTWWRGWLLSEDATAAWFRNCDVEMGSALTRELTGWEGVLWRRRRVHLLLVSERGPGSLQAAALRTHSGGQCAGYLREAGEQRAAAGTPTGKPGALQGPAGAPSTIYCTCTVQPPADRPGLCGQNYTAAHHPWGCARHNCAHSRDAC